ncbi:MAG: DNA polymerase III subunit gamma/tau [Clostridia bacterium]|nr:DNA polymerase III subunit gamma/tau [Clostridia bacterium]
MYQALYRKWRPKDFSDVYGQPHVTRTLRSQLESGRISHAYLFTGSRGTGKTTCAKILSKAVNCLNPVDGNPCNECEICRGIENGSILDVIEIDAASNNGVDNIRDLREEANFTPANAKYRVYIIDEVHMLSIGAFNALLKTLEEPPSHVIFILATTEIHKLPSTILSRCQRFDFKRIAPEDITARLMYVAEKENVNLTSNAASLIARIADGGMRDALSLLDRCFAMGTDIDENTVSDAAGIAGTVHLFSFSEFVANGDFTSSLRLVSKLHSESCDIDSLCTELTLHFRNLMVAKTVGDCEGLIVCSKDELAKTKERASQLKLSKILSCIEILEQTAKNIKNAANKKIQLEAAVIKMCAPSSSSGEGFSADLEERISKIEEKLLSLASGAVINPAQVQRNTQPETVPYVPEEKPAEAPKPAFQPAPVPKEEPKAKEYEAPPVPETPSVPPAPAEISDIPDGNFDNWADVLDKLMKYDIPLFGILSNSSASIKNGRVIIHSDNSTLFDFICTDTHSKELARAVYEVMGRKMKIAVSNSDKPKADKSPLENLKAKINQFNSNN